MQYLFLGLFILAVFLLCWGVDSLLKKLFPKHHQQFSGKAVRLPRKGAILGILLSFLAFVAELFYASRLEWYYHLCCLAAGAMGVFLLFQYLRFAVYYDADSFLYRDIRRKAKTFSYKQIRGQRSLLTRSGVNTTLYLEEDEIILYSAMQGVDEFLRFAFARWCEEKGIDPESVENNPQYLTYFPEIR